MNVKRGLFYMKIMLGALPSAQARRLVAEAWRLERRLPHWFESHPLLQLMQLLDREAGAGALHAGANVIVRYADAVSMLDYRSPLGVCLRRSLVRYVLLRRAGVPVVVHFGARKLATDQSRIAGHAWLTLDGQAFAENPQDYEGFAAIYSYPQE